MKNKQINILRISIYLTVILFCTLLYDFIINSTSFPFKFLGFIYIDIPEQDIRSFLYTVWQVQTSISILSITFITIILVKLDQRILGMTLTDVLLINNRILLNYWETVLMSILVIFANLVFVSRGMLSASTLIFLFSGGIILKLLFDSLMVIINPEAQHKKVIVYLENNIDKFLEKENNN
ncbi:hypothetical protein ACQKOM_25065 [Peribacillus frigoritolerans]|uniref:hypothetical protein n=1 Tax=Peribacillus frigoritolerans TaxID=450367 RepID=UPI003D06D47B